MYSNDVYVKKKDQTKGKGKRRELNVYRSLYVSSIAETLKGTKGRERWAFSDGVEMN